jgi:hypothetical protein
MRPLRRLDLHPVDITALLKLNVIKQNKYMAINYLVPKPKIG